MLMFTPEEVGLEVKGGPERRVRREDMEDAVPTIPGPRPGRAAPTPLCTQLLDSVSMASAKGLTVKCPVDMEGTSSYFFNLSFVGGHVPRPQPRGGAVLTRPFSTSWRVWGMFRVPLAMSVPREGTRFLARGLPFRLKLSHENV